MVVTLFFQGEVLQVKYPGNRHENGNVDHRQNATDFNVIPSLVATGAHVQGIDLVGGQDKGIGNPNTHDNGCHTRVDPDLVGDGNSQGDKKGAGPDIGNDSTGRKFPSRIDTLPHWHSFLYDIPLWRLKHYIANTASYNLGLILFSAIFCWGLPPLRWPKLNPSLIILSLPFKISLFA